MNGIELEFMIKDRIWNLTKEAEEMRNCRNSSGKGILSKKFCNYSASSVASLSKAWLLVVLAGS